MPTKPLESILYRELSRASARDLIEVACPLLQELVNHATNALSRCALSSSGKTDVDLAGLALYRHLIEITDGIEVLVSQCCALPAIPLLRSSFESLLAIEYLLKEKTEYERRALSWFVSYAYQRLALYERLDPTSGRGKQARDQYKDDLVLLHLENLPLEKIPAAEENLRDLLAKPHLQGVVAEYARFKHPHWYQLFSGPPNLERLARHLRRSALYDVLYRPWSRHAHAQDLVPLLQGSKRGKFSLGRVREPSQLRQVSGLAASFMLSGTRQMLAWYRPGENLKRWYTEEVQQRYNAINITTT